MFANVRRPSLAVSRLLALQLLLSPFRFCEATFTVAGVDIATQQVGGAGSTCIEQDGISLFEKAYYSVPGKAAFLAQGLIHDSDSPVIALAQDLINNNTEAATVLDSISSPMVDTGIYAPDYPYDVSNLRQYGLVNLVPLGDAAAYTGPALTPLYADFEFPPSSNTDQHGFDGERFAYSAQGNIVADGTVSNLGEGFQAPIPDEFCDDLAQRLYNSVLRTYNAGLGDIRCANGIGSTSFLHIDNPDGTPLISIKVAYDASGEDFDPFVPLKEQFATWREANPCSTNDTSGATGARSFGSFVFLALTACVAIFVS